MSETNNKEEIGEEISRVVCAPANGLAPVPGSRVEVCSKCNADVFVSPSTLITLNGNPYIPVCVHCFSEEMRTGADYKFIPTHARQVEEVQKFGKSHGFNPETVTAEHMDRLVSAAMTAMKEGKLYGPKSGGHTD